MRLSILLLAIASPLLTLNANAARFSGGMCASQGSWLQDALKQSRLIISALETLKDDPNCKLLSNALESLPKVSPSNLDEDSQTSFANTYRELSALNDFMNPARMKNGMNSSVFQSAVFEVVFNKSFKSIKDLNTQINPNYTEEQQDSIRNVSMRLKTFLARSRQVANMSMATSRSVLSVLPQSKRCLHNKPSAAAAIFGAIAHTAASLVSGGEMNGVGEFTSALMTFSRDSNYIKSITPLELQEFKNSVSCLVESTSESYCSIQDAEDALEALKKTGGRKGFNLKFIMDQSPADPVASPLAGLVIYMRDIPVVQAWLQKVLTGLAPRTAWQGRDKNDNWNSYLGFIQSVNELQANFTDKEQQYLSATAGKDRMAKLGQVREIFQETINVITKGARGNSVNFFARTVQDPNQVPFFLLSLDMPSDFNAQTNDFYNYWLKYSRDGINGFDNPDRLLQTLRENLWKMMAKAQIEANALFSNRMVVDPHNLVTEAMRGPGVSPYQAFIDQRVYYNNLITKLDRSAKEMKGSSQDAIRAKLLRSHIPLLRDSVSRIDKVIAALDSVSDVAPNGEDSAAFQSEKIMNVIQEAANMLVSWDSFFGTRMQTALQADLSDTLWRKTPITDRQREYLLSVGPDIVGKLSGFFANNPVSERTDLNSAKLVHIANLRAVEEQFAKVLFNEILSITCKLEGGYACDAMSYGKTYDPVKDPGSIIGVNNLLANMRKGNLSFLQRYLRRSHQPQDDAVAFVQTRAKLCVQALAFQSRDSFKEVCRGAVLESEFSDRTDNLGLNLDFDSQLKLVSSVQSDSQSGKIDRARGIGVCSLRTYLRKNHIYYMYRDYNADNRVK